MKQRRGPCNGVEIGVTHLLRWIDAAEKSELLSGSYVHNTRPKVPGHTLRALAEGNEFAAQYVLANILYAEGRDDEIRDSMFLSTALSIAGCGASEPSGDTGSREQNNSAVGTGHASSNPVLPTRISAGQRHFLEREGASRA